MTQHYTTPYTISYTISHASLISRLISCMRPTALTPLFMLSLSLFPSFIWSAAEQESLLVQTTTQPTSHTTQTAESITAEQARLQDVNAIYTEFMKNIDQENSRLADSLAEAEEKLRLEQVSLMQEYRTRDMNKNGCEN